jgi:regulator of sigma E protease
MLILVTVHEYGHYRAAVACGVAVRRFSVGFGAPVWRWQRDAQSTEFVIARWPLGGYVRMVDEADGDVPAALLPRAFNRQPLRARAFIVAAGPMANAVLAVVLYALVQWLGVEQALPKLATPAAHSLAERANVRAGDVVQWVRLGDDAEPTAMASMEALRWQLAQAVVQGRDVVLGVSPDGGGPLQEIRLGVGALASREPDAATMNQIGLGQVWMAPRLREIVPGGAAERAQLHARDWVLRIDGAQIADVQALRERIRQAVDSQGRAVPQRWEIERAGRRMNLVVTPDVLTEEGAVVGRLGVLLGEAPQTVIVQAGLWDGLVGGTHKAWEVAALSLRTLVHMVWGQASLDNLSGPVSVAQAAGQSASVGLLAYLEFLGFFSVSLAVINVLPIPMLDGGHLMYYLWELVSGRAVSAAWMQRGQRLGVLLLVSLMALALSNDLARLLG